MTTPDIRTLGRLIDEWRSAPEVLRSIAELEGMLAACDEPFLGLPLADRLVRGRLPSGIASAWVFVLRANHLNPAHLHPNSTQYTAAIRGGGTGFFGKEELALRNFDAAHPDETLYVIPPGTAHAFATGSEGLVVVSFHTVAPEELLEIEVGTSKSRTYVADERAGKADS